MPTVNLFPDKNGLPTVTGFPDTFEPGMEAQVTSVTPRADGGKHVDADLSLAWRAQNMMKRIMPYHPAQ
jgi:hypothetical protein